MDDAGSRRGAGCSACRDGQALGIDIAMAFQPIVDVAAGVVRGYEALVRGPNGEPAAEVLGRVDDGNRYAFDQRCRVVAIETATALGIAATGARLSINFMPNAVYSPAACIRLTLATARRCGLPLDRLTFEFTEHERVADVAHVRAIIAEYQRHGFKVALDDVGEGYASLALLADLRPDVLKLDRRLVRGVDGDAVRAAILRGIVQLARELAIALVAEGVETAAESRTLVGLGIDLQQGFWLARPALGALPRPMPVGHGGAAPIEAAAARA